MLKFPAFTLVKFFENHGFLGLNTQHQWRTVQGGSREYRDRLIAPFRDRIFTRRSAVKVQRTGSVVKVTDSTGNQQTFDSVIVACHADQALALLQDPTPMEELLLSAFSYQKNVATLHTDFLVMPRTRRAWSSWNYRIQKHPATEQPETSVIYYMNSLQQVSQKADYFLSINDPGTVHPEKILQVIEYEHPVFSLESLRAQPLLLHLNSTGPVYYCGSYFRYGFHEDALQSAVELCKNFREAEIAA
jgi:predicted NAD/FAD-binding protein